MHQKFKAVLLALALCAGCAQGADDVFDPLENPSTPAQWEKFTTISYQGSMAYTQSLLEKYDIKVESLDIAGVPCYIFTPKELRHDNLLYFVHGGGYVLGPGLAGAPEGLIMAARAGYKVLAVDYRMPPAEEPFPAAVDDMMAVYQEITGKYAPQSVGVFGSSTGGAMTLILAQECKRLNLPLPGALISGTPWSDIGLTGDTYTSNDRQDVVLVSGQGWIKAAAELYANGTPYTDPRLSPVYGSFDNFPPTMLVSGTRDLFLSNTVRVQEKLLKAGVPTELLVLEGASHCSYYLFNDTDMAEFYHEQAERFWQQHLAPADSTTATAAQ